MQVQRMVGAFGIFILVIFFLMLVRANLRKPPPPLVFPPPPTMPEPEKPPELLPEPSVEPDPPPKPAEPDPVVPFIATPELVVAHMLAMANVKRTDVLYDLGSGDGRIVILAARQFNARAFGYEINPALVKKSREAILKQKLEKLATIEQRNIYRLDLSKGTVVTLYLSVEANLKLVPQLEKMRPGARIVSHQYPIEGYKPVLKDTVTVEEDGMKKDHLIWLYTIPLKKE